MSKPQNIPTSSKKSKPSTPTELSQHQTSSPSPTPPQPPQHQASPPSPTTAQPSQVQPTSWVYTDLVKQHFLSPHNFLMGDETKYPADGQGIVGNPICGDQMLMMIQVDPITSTITDVKWKTYGCASAIASTSALSDLAIGRTLDAAQNITAAEIADYLGGLPPNKFHCSVLGHEALAKAIADYRTRHTTTNS